MEIFGALPTCLQQSTYRASASVSKDWLSTSIRLDFHFVRGAAGLSRKLRFCELHPDHLSVLRPKPPCDDVGLGSRMLCSHPVVII